MLSPVALINRAWRIEGSTLVRGMTRERCFNDVGISAKVPERDGGMRNMARGFLLAPEIQRHTYRRTCEILDR